MLRRWLVIPVLGCVFLFLWIVVGPLLPLWEESSHLEESKALLFGLCALLLVEIVWAAVVWRLLSGLTRVAAVIVLTFLPGVVAALFNEWRPFDFYGAGYFRTSGAVVPFNVALILVYIAWPLLTRGKHHVSDPSEGR